jgi:hypothetical protein
MEYLRAILVCRYGFGTQLHSGDQKCTKTKYMNMIEFLVFTRLFVNWICLARTNCMIAVKQMQ